MPASVHSVQAAREGWPSTTRRSFGRRVEDAVRGSGAVGPGLRRFHEHARRHRHRRPRPRDAVRDGRDPRPGWTLRVGSHGALLSQVSHGVAVAFGIIGVVRTVYPSVFGQAATSSFPSTPLWRSAPRQPGPRRELRAHGTDEGPGGDRRFLLLVGTGTGVSSEQRDGLPHRDRPRGPAGHGEERSGRAGRGPRPKRLHGLRERQAAGGTRSAPTPARAGFSIDRGFDHPIPL
jgi:hypothetical protein